MFSHDGAASQRRQPLLFCWCCSHTSRIRASCWCLSMRGRLPHDAGLVGRIVIAIFVCDATLVGEIAFATIPASVAHSILGLLCAMAATKAHRFVTGERLAVADISTLCSINFAMVVLEMP
jgi:multidrug transporter EmrE-like cation transporter